MRSLGIPRKHGELVSSLLNRLSRGDRLAMINAKYVHTNLIADDWHSLARFYQEVFGCVPVPPERNFRGSELERGTGLRGAILRGVHLRLPGQGERGPTLEIFTYGSNIDRSTTAVNRPGFGHLGFEVDDVGKAQKAVLAAGGHTVGEIVTLQLATGAKVTWCYVSDPEGNVIELQSWSDKQAVTSQPDEGWVDAD